LADPQRHTGKMQQPAAKGSLGTCSLGLPSPFSIRWTTDHIRTSSYGAPYTWVSETRFRRVLKVAGCARLVEYALASGEDDPSLVLAMPHDPEPKRPRAHSGKRVGAEFTRISRFIFGMDDDLQAAYAVLDRIPRISRLVIRYDGLRLFKAPDLYEALLIAVLGQQVSVASAQSQRRRLMTVFGEKIRFEGQDYFGLPDPGRMLDLGEDRLREIGISRQKSRYLVQMAQGAVDGRLVRESFDGESCEGAIERLMRIPGVGRWTAEIVAMRGLGFQDVFPAGDLGLQAAVQKTFGMDHRPSEKALRELSCRWKGYRSYAALYLWMTLMEQGYA